MTYQNLRPAVFLARPNRFVARVEVDGREETVHVKNTGRCRELLVPGCAVYLEGSANPQRKTRFDLVAVEKARLRLHGLHGVHVPGGGPRRQARRLLHPAAV